MKKVFKYLVGLSLGLSLTACASGRPYIGSNGNWWVDGNDLGVSATGEKGDKGEKVTVSTISYTRADDNLYYFTITFSDGAHQDFSMPKPQDGTPGINGANLTISSIEKQAPVNEYTDTYRIIFSDGNHYDFTVTNGKDGQDGAPGAPGAAGADGANLSVISVQKTGSNGHVDTYTITYSDDTKTTFTVTNATTCLNGHGEPANDLGENGDMYINLDTWNVYEKKEGSWDLTGNIHGKSTLNGTSAPTNEMGFDGDIYIDTSSWNIYTKASGTWTQVGNIHGETPHIGDNGNWWIGTEDTGILADISSLYEDTRVFSDGLRFEAVVQGGVAGFIVASYEGSDTDVVIPNYIGTAKVIGIDREVFADKDSITSVTLSKFTNYIGPGTFRDCINIANINLNESAVEVIKEEAFRGCTSLTEYTISEKATYIGANAFCECPAEISFAPNAIIERIENSAFRLWKGTSMTIPGSVKEIGNSAFRQCENLTNLVIEEGSSINVGEYAFSSCNSLESVTINSQLIDLKQYAFGSCSFLTTVRFAGTVTVGQNAFYSCLELNDIDIQNIRGDIGNSAFYGCEALTSADLPEGVTTVGSSAFFDCYHITSITIPSTVTSIGNSAFLGCVRVATINYNATNCADLSANQHVFNTVGSYTSGISLTIGNTVSKIPNYLFCPYSDSAAAPNITSITFAGASTCQSIGSYAFANCINFSSISIPLSVTRIGEHAFSNCSDLINVVFGITTGWYVSTDPAATSGTTINNADLSNSSTAATLLRSSYVSYYWFRSQ